MGDGHDGHDFGHEDHDGHDFGHGDHDGHDYGQGHDRQGGDADHGHDGCL